MGGKIEPRTCKYCRHFGHTRQWCKIRIKNEKIREEREKDLLLAEDDLMHARCQEVPVHPAWVKHIADGEATYDALVAIKPYGTWGSDEWRREFLARRPPFDYDKHFPTAENDPYELSI